ncbi:acyl-CoA thioesterase [Spongiimicrobium sp. 3-5]|uniref:acyl-CoA thioesterase n=1 Tax=Spongiimicrobium sp. 3-5 TaxID=3332596 RepID=UPI0039807410
MTNTYEMAVQVAKDDLDELHHVNNVRYVQWVQDIAKEHWISYAPKEVQDNVVWVLLRHHINYKSEAKYKDLVKMKTYVAKTEGAKSIRIVEMYNDTTKEPLVHSETEWCLLNAKSLRPIRVSEEIKKVFEKKKSTAN